MEMKQWRPALLAGAGASMAIALLGWLDLSWQLTLLMAPFGASCVLLFSLPQSPLARPQNVLGGHLLSATLGLLVQLLPDYQPQELGIHALYGTRRQMPPALRALLDFLLERLADRPDWDR